MSFVRKTAEVKAIQVGSHIQVLTDTYPELKDKLHYGNFDDMCGFNRINYVTIHGDSLELNHNDWIVIDELGLVRIYSDEHFKSLYKEIKGCKKESRTDHPEKDSDWDEPKQVLKLSPELVDGDHWTISTRKTDLMQYINAWYECYENGDNDEGDSFQIEVIMMSDKEIHELPEI